MVREAVMRRPESFAIIGRLSAKRFTSVLTNAGATINNVAKNIVNPPITQERLNTLCLTGAYSPVTTALDILRYALRLAA